MKLDERKLEEYFKGFLKCTDEEQIKSIKDSEDKFWNTLSKVGAKLRKEANKLILFFHMVKDWLSGDYIPASTNSLILAAVAILYFLSPIDFIPDLIPGLGFIDDIFIALKIWHTIQDEIRRYAEWKSTHSASKIVKRIIEEAFKGGEM